MGTDVEASRADDEERVRIAWHILTALHAAGFSAELVVADDPAIEVVPLIPDWETGFSESAAHRAGAGRRRAAPSLSERDSAEHGHSGRSRHTAADLQSSNAQTRVRSIGKPGDVICSA